MKIIEVILNKKHKELINSLINAKHDEIIDSWQYTDDSQNRIISNILVTEAYSQEVLDSLDLILNKTSSSRIIVNPVDSSLPRPESSPSPAKTARETLLKDADQNAHLNTVFISMVILSTIVASIGMLENNIAVIIGAMVIAPLLGPNLSLAVGTALGEGPLMLNALRTLTVGLIITIGFSAILGALWQGPLDQLEILSRTEVHLSTIILALASGAAAVLSMTTNISSSLVGVMVAVAILPPASVLGMMLGGHHYALAQGAGLLLAINIAAINLAANTVMLLRNISPKDKKHQQKAKRTIIISTLVWLAILIYLSNLILSDI